MAVLIVIPEIKLEEEELKFSEILLLLRHFACHFRY